MIIVWSNSSLFCRFWVQARLIKKVHEVCGWGSSPHGDKGMGCDVFDGWAAWESGLAVVERGLAAVAKMHPRTV